MVRGSRLRAGGPAGERALEPAIALAVRGLLLIVAAGLSVLGGVHLRNLVGVLVLLVALSLSVWIEAKPMPARLLRLTEAAVVAATVVFAHIPNAPVLPYLLAPAFAAGLLAGLDDALTIPTLGALVMIVGRLLVDTPVGLRDYTAAAAEWVVLATAVGLLAAWLRRLLTERDTPQQSYAAAYRLLSQLRSVARQLPGSLDTVTLAAALVEGLAAAGPFDHAAVFARSAGDRLVPLAYGGTGRREWDIDLRGDNPFAEAWAAQAPRVSPRRHARGGPRGGSMLVLPLKVGVRSVGLVVLETPAVGAYPAEVVAGLQRIADEAALRLETALLFEEVREVATAEERRRLAREIHDGIAQELAALGYAIDALTNTAEDAGAPDVEADLRALRAELTRIVTELRLSIFDLRSEVDRHGGLGAALSEYVRSVGTGSAMTVHLSLDESPARLPAESEAELLRIAQEAVTNARKHAGARNLWVSCAVDPPHVLLRIEDDGTGISRSAREHSFGLEVMRERADRLRAQLHIGPRSPAGTIVEVCVGTPPADTVADGGQAGRRTRARDGAARR